MRGTFSGLTTASALAATAAFAALVASDYPAKSQEICGTRQDIVAALARDFKEQPNAMGVVDKNVVMEVFVSDTGTWTMIASGTDGNSCIIASGEGWDGGNGRAKVDVGA